VAAFQLSPAWKTQSNCWLTWICYRTHVCLLSTTEHRWVVAQLKFDRFGHNRSVCFLSHRQTDQHNPCPTLVYRTAAHGPFQMDTLLLVRFFIASMHVVRTRGHRDRDSVAQRCAEDKQRAFLLMRSLLMLRACCATDVWSALVSSRVAIAYHSPHRRLAGWPMRA
jgi:hypothetical protein